MSENDRIVPREANPKQRYGDAKPALGLIPPPALVVVALAMMEGARKYGPFNWRNQPVELATYHHAMLRHQYAWFDGEDIDPESGYLHAAHAVASGVILLDAYLLGNYIDNRPRRGITGDLLRRYQRAA